MLLIEKLDCVDIEHILKLDCVDIDIVRKSRFLIYSHSQIYYTCFSIYALDILPYANF